MTTGTTRGHLRPAIPIEYLDSPLCQDTLDERGVAQLAHDEVKVRLVLVSQELM